MPDLYPMQPLGEANDSSERLLYAERNPIGYEDPAAALTDFTGWNEARAFTRRGEAHLLEHSGWGLHLTLKVPQIFVVYGFHPTVGHRVHASSYIQDDVGQVVLRGVNILSGGVGGINRLAQGRTEFTFAFDFNAPAANRVALREFQDSAVIYDLNGDNYSHIKLEIESVTLPNKIVVRRFQFGNRGGAGPGDEDGSYIFGVHCS